MKLSKDINLNFGKSENVDGKISIKLSNEEENNDENEENDDEANDSDELAFELLSILLEKDDEAISKLFGYEILIL